VDYKKQLDLPFDLRDYQKTGVEFLSSNSSALLGDDMGLGKTIQVIVSLKKMYSENGIFRCLIVVPNSLRTNWLKEFSLWFPNAVVTDLQGNLENRSYTLETYSGFVICTYEQLRGSFTQNHRIPPFELLVYDEVQRLKNSSSQVYMSAYGVIAKKVWAMSGTPLENSINDIVNIFNLIKSGIIQKGLNASEVASAIAPYLLRRLKVDVLDELPDLIEENVYIDLGPEQLKEYSDLYNSRFSINEKDSAGLLALITELKKLANFSQKSRKSAKLDYLKELLNELLSKGEKVLIFSQYVKTLEFIEEELKFPVLMYHGGMDQKQKDKTINNFKTGDINILLMSLMAGGVGLNIQEASTVIIFDRWWNPAIESQAIARAHRMGRKDPVHAIKFVASGTIEERILEILHDKEDLFDFVIEGAVEKGNEKRLTQLLDLEEDE